MRNENRGDQSKHVCYVYPKWKQWAVSVQSVVQFQTFGGFVTTVLETFSIDKSSFLYLGLVFFF